MQFANGEDLRVERAWIGLQPGDSLVLQHRRGTLLQLAPPPCIGADAPLLWLTEEGLTDDLFLRPGDSYRLLGRGRAVATAWGPVSVRVLEAPPQRRSVPAGFARRSLLANAR